MTKKEIKQAIKDGKPMVWKDPDPIKGNDYTIKEVFDLYDETCLIHYGMGSEAEVYLHEIQLKP